MDPDPAGFRVVGSGPDPDPAGSKMSRSGLDPDPAGSENCGSGAPLLEINMHHLPKAMQYRQAPGAILTKFCVVVGFLYVCSVKQNFNVVGIDMSA